MTKVKAATLGYQHFQFLVLLHQQRLQAPNLPQPSDTIERHRMKRLSVREVSHLALILIAYPLNLRSVLGSSQLKLQAIQSRRHA